MSEEAMRKTFEAEFGRHLGYKQDGRGFATNKDGTYVQFSVNQHWDLWQAATRAAVPAWQPIETAPKSEATSFMVLRKGVAIQVSWFEGRLYPDAREACIDWEEGITDATHWRPLPPAPEESHDRENRFVNA